MSITWGTWATITKMEYANNYKNIKSNEKKMREKNRIKRILLKLETLWNIYPDLRLGQIIINLCRFDEPAQKDPFNVEDNILEYKIEMAILKVTKKTLSVNTKRKEPEK